MMNKYISGIIHCLDTVPSLKKALVKAFKGVDVVLDSKQGAIKSMTITGSASANGNFKISADTIKVVSIILDSANICAIPYIGSDGTYIHILNVVTPVDVVNGASANGTVYYID